MLSLRLQAIAELVEKDLVLADVGCDHAYLVIDLLKSKKLRKAYAIDNKKEPLNSALMNIKSAGLENEITALLGDGISNLPADVRQICIAGLGGNVIAKILDDEHIRQLDYLVLEGNNDSSLIRKALLKHEFKIIDERLVVENDVIYEIIKATKGHQELSEDDIYFGPILRKKKDELFYKKWSSYQQYLIDVYAKIPEKYQARRLENDKEIQRIRKEIGNGI